MYPEDLRYTREHEWIRVTGSRGTVGITFYAQEQLGDVVFVELPKVGATVVQGQAFGVVESVKTASDLYAPASGTVSRVNDQLVDRPELVNQSSYDDGWMIEIDLTNPAQVNSLLTAEQYEELIRH